MESSKIYLLDGIAEKVEILEKHRKSVVILTLKNNSKNVYCTETSFVTKRHKLNVSLKESMYKFKNNIQFEELYSAATF